MGPTSVPAFELSRCRPSLTSTTSSQAEVLVTGRAVTRSFELTGVLTCASRSWEMESVRVELLDDDNRPIAHDDWLSIQPQEPRPPVLARHLEVTFIPPATKAVHLRLVVEPSIGAIVHSMPVFQATPRTWVEEPRTCDGLLEREAGAPICVRAGQIELVSSIGLQRVDVVAAATTTSMVWLFRQYSNFEGWRLTGDVATRAFIARTSFPTSLATRGSRLVSGSDFGLSVFDEDGGVTSLTVFPPEPAILAVTFIDDATLLVARQGQLLRVPIVDGPLSLPAPVGEPQVASASDDGIWRKDVTSNVLELHRLDGGRADVRLPAGSSVAWPRGVPDLVPVVRLGHSGPTSELIAVPVPAPDGGLALDFIELSDGVRPQWATSRRLFVTRPDGTLLMTSRVP